MDEETVPGELHADLARQASARTRVHTVPLLVIGLVATAIGIVIGLAIDWFPVQASTQAAPIDTLYHVLIITSVPFFVLVTTIVLYCVWQFRERPGHEGDGPSTHGNTKLEVVWTAVPAILLIALCTYSAITLRDIEEAPAAGEPRELIVNVTGQQFAWTFSYPRAGGPPVKSAELILPKDRSVKFQIKALDVIHDLWVPEFRMKVDAVPGITTSYRVTPSREGEWSVVCAELCGIGHALMRQKVRVVSEPEFAAWLDKKQAGGTAAPRVRGTSDALAVGRTLFAEGNGETAACGACHTLADANTSGQSGPNLDKALTGWTSEQIRTAIVDPNAEIAQGFAEGIMPANYGETLTDAERDALVTYLRETAGK